MIHVPYSARAWLGGALVLTALVFGPLTQHAALAGYTSCKSDPRVYLSNGTIFNLSVTVSDSASDVRGVAYTLHGPAGTTVTKTIYTGNAFADKESFQYYADQPAYTYSSGIVVTTGIRSAVVGVTTLTSVSSAVRMSSSVSGYSGQDLGAQLYYHP